MNSLLLNGSNVFAGTSSSVYLSKDNGQSWTQINEGMGNQNVYSLAISEDYIYAGTDNSVWRRPLSDIVPVELISFSASINNGVVELNWITSTETNNKGFEIERSKNGSYETIGFVDGHGTTTETQAYYFTDKNVVTGNYKYRLKQIDFDGTF